MCVWGGKGGRMNEYYNSGRYGGLYTRLTFKDGTDSGTTLPNAGRHLFKKESCYSHI